MRTIAVRERRVIAHILYDEGNSHVHGELGTKNKTETTMILYNNKNFTENTNVGWP